MDAGRCLVCVVAGLARRRCGGEPGVVDLAFLFLVIRKTYKSPLHFSISGTLLNPFFFFVFFDSPVKVF